MQSQHPTLTTMKSPKSFTTNKSSHALDMTFGSFSHHRNIPRMLTLLPEHCNTFPLICIPILSKPYLNSGLCDGDHDHVIPNTNNTNPPTHPPHVQTPPHDELLMKCPTHATDWSWKPKTLVKLRICSHKQSTLLLKIASVYVTQHPVSLPG